MAILITLNNRPALLNKEANEVCYLPRHYELIEALGKGIVGAIDTDTNQTAQLEWRLLNETDDARAVVDQS